MNVNDKAMYRTSRNELPSLRPGHALDRVDDGKLGEGHAGTTSQVHILYPQPYPYFEEKS